MADGISSLASTSAAATPPAATARPIHLNTTCKAAYLSSLSAFPELPTPIPFPMPNLPEELLKNAAMTAQISTPEWLLGLTKESIEHGPLPLLGILRGSVYYPAAGTDGRDVEMLSHYAASFIHVDYRYKENEIESQLREPQCFAGYELVGLRRVEKQELTPAGWRPSLPNPTGHRDLPASANAVNSFALWAVFARKSTHGPRQGAERFSLLHLHAEGVAAYDALYRGNDAQARFFVIIGPGEGYGDNWTRFTESGNYLHRLVMSHPQGPPAYLVYEGEQPCWPEFGRLVKEMSLYSGGTSINIKLWSLSAPLK